MSKPLLPEMIAATRLTREGRLHEATAILQKLLGGSSSPEAGSHVFTVAPLVIDATAEDVTREREEGARAEKASDAGASRAKPSLKDALAGVLKGLGVHGQPLPHGLKRAPPSPSDLCPSNGTFVAKSFSNQAVTRPYKLYIPSGHHGQPRPLIIMLHGCTQSPDDFAAGTRMNFVAEEHACFVAYPEQIASANSSKCWNWFQRDHQTRDQGEPSLIAGIARQLESEHNIDPDRVYIAGLSAGGAAAAVVAEAYPDVFAALGVHSGVACGVAHDLPSAFSAMKGRPAGAAASKGSPVPTIVFHGDRDTTVHPSNGGEIVARAAAGESFWQEVEHGTIQAGRSYTRSVHRDDAGRELIEEWVIHGAGHAWSGGSAAGSFTDPLGPDATKAMLTFFLQHKRGG